MGFHLDGKLMCEREYSFQTTLRLERGKREEKLREIVPPGQPFVNHFAIEPVQRTLLAELQRKISPHNGSRRQQTLHQNIRAKVHMMMAVDSIWFCPVEAAEFVELRFYDIFEGSGKPGVKNYLGEPVTRQISSYFLLPFDEAWGTVRS